ncbi:DUF2243 domain-containing protein [Mumia sp. zg.B53]|uniref:DUF2243 domain-containing protein n=1 Tax=unclassified Mumia TaxID=2621872 RepID=UPI001C6F3AB1|nr:MULTISPECIES: DUF2243 domain-containing protein [unclassified Mumia]MBW9207907.1 DUF2243 domain-containing protein [Mumia sp. zg.B17]MBW9214350.1 DUF2243 domain-containing protein [Mumia sp. zg.B53]MDD9347434.1 DUF2243 domain-containing protein [Mumia sp.]
MATSTSPRDGHATLADRPPSLALPGIVLGAGLGGFVDGILLHQILQWHHLLTSTNTDNIGVPYYPANTVHGLEINTLWDGIFHAVTWVLVLTGLALLYSRVQHSRGRVWASRALWGWVLVGWGVFNLVEGIVDHHLLGIHHVRSGPNELAWDLAFLALGAVLVLVGWLLQRGATFTDDRAVADRA